MTNGDRLRIFRETIGANQSEFAQVLDVAPSFISGIERNTKAISRDLIERLLNKYNININWLLTGEGAMLRTALVPAGQELAKQETALENAMGTGHKRLPVYRESELPAGAFVVPLLDQRLSAGNGSYLPEEDEAKALIHVPAYLARYGDQIRALEVDGDSMYPTLHRGDMVVCDSCGWSGEGVYAVRMNGKGFVKP
jgi:phage repressor protein C with HTH and peptisase S24 domain